MREMLCASGSAEIPQGRASAKVKVYRVNVCERGEDRSGEIKRYVHGINLSCPHCVINKRGERNAFCNSRVRSTQDLKVLYEE